MFSRGEGGGWGAADHWQCPSSLFIATVVGAVACCTAHLHAGSPFATSVLVYDPAPGQLVLDPQLSNATAALGAPSGMGGGGGSESGLVTLGGFGGTITLGFEETVVDDRDNPLGLDAIVFGNAFWVGGNENRRWGESGIIEISRDANSNGLADDDWFLIPGSHIDDPLAQFLVQTWDDDLGDMTHPPFLPATSDWIPLGESGTWTSQGYLLSGPPFDSEVIENPNGLMSSAEGVFGYADLSPVEPLPMGVSADEFYVRPDDPLEVGISPGSGGGDGFDIAWAIDPVTGANAELDRFDFIRITTGVNFVSVFVGEASTEIDAVADVAAVSTGDANGDGLIDLDDYGYLFDCLQGPEVVVPTSPCRVVDFDDDGDVDLDDARVFQESFDE